MCGFGKLQKPPTCLFINNMECKALSNAPLGLREGDNKLRTGHSSIKCPVQGIIVVKGSQFFSTRVTLRHYMILKRLPDQQRISTNMGAASGGSTSESTRN